MEMFDKLTGHFMCYENRTSVCVIYKSPVIALDARGQKE